MYNNREAEAKGRCAGVIGYDCCMPVGALWAVAWSSKGGGREARGGSRRCVTWSEGG